MLRRHWLATMAVFVMVAGALRGSVAAQGGRGFDHGSFDRVLREHARKDGVDYASVARAADLAAYLVQLEAADPRALAGPERLAFWINAYNAHTIHAVAIHKPATSIKDIVLPDRTGQKGTVWKAPIVKVGGRTYTLDEVEHDAIRKSFKDPRVHFALVCAALSCPPLRLEAYTGARLEEQLEDQARSFLHGRAKGCRVDAARGVLHVSEIFRWYQEDFGDDVAIGRYIARYLPDSIEQRVLESGRFQVVAIPFDWRLNDAGATVGSQP